MNRTALQVFFAVILLIASVSISALIAYASSMAILVLGLQDYGDYIMLGVFIVSSIVIFASNFGWIDNFAAKKVKESEEKTRDYFRDGNFSRKT